MVERSRAGAREREGEKRKREGDGGGNWVPYDRSAWGGGPIKCLLLLLGGGSELWRIWAGVRERRVGREGEVEEVGVFLDVEALSFGQNLICSSPSF